jgi:hypothetical protein
MITEHFLPFAAERCIGVTTDGALEAQCAQCMRRINAHQSDGQPMLTSPQFVNNTCQQRIQAP